MALKLVPFSEAWISHDKIDIHAIYRRPRFVQDEYGEWHREYRDGLPTWDLTGPLPVRQHNRWRSKGFEYVTLANRNSLIVASRFKTLPPDTTARDFDQHQDGGPWSYRKYQEGLIIEANDKAMLLRADVNRFGSDVVELLMKRSDAGFELPPELRNKKPGDLDPPAEPVEAPPPKANGKAPRVEATA